MILNNLWNFLKIQVIIKIFVLKGPVAHNVSLGIEKDPLNTLGGEKQPEKKPAEGSELPVVRSKSYKSEMMVVKLPRESPEQNLGIFIAKTPDSSPGYLVAHVVPDGLADREGSLKIGDEILIVNGKRLRGLTMAEARKALGSGGGPGVVDIVISR